MCVRNLFYFAPIRIFYLFRPIVIDTNRMLCIDLETMPYYMIVREKRGYIYNNPANTHLKLLGFQGSEAAELRMVLCFP